MEYCVYVKYKTNEFWIHIGTYPRWMTAREKIGELLNSNDCETCKIERKITVYKRNENLKLTKSIVFYYHEEIGNYNLLDY